MNISQSQIVALAYIGTWILAFVIFGKSFEWIWHEVEALQQQVFFGILSITNGLAIVSASLLIVWMRKHPQIDPFIHETAAELRKVTWPNWKDTQSNTIQVTVFTVILAFFLWGADQVWRPVTDYILTIGF
jgi:preprotein translocase subunit SecE